MLFLIQKLLAVMLAMDVQKLSADLAQLGNSQRAAIGAATFLPSPPISRCNSDCRPRQV